MSNKSRHLILISILITATIFTVGMLTTIRAPEAADEHSVDFRDGKPLKGNIGFGAVISDEKILYLLNRHKAVPSAAFMWTFGLTATHRSYEPKSAEAFLKEARDKIIETFDNSLQGNLMRLQYFEETYTEEEVVASEDLQNQVRSLLNIRAAFEAALSSVKNGEPLIFSLEVVSSKDHLENLAKDEIVRDFELASKVSGKVRAPYTQKPLAYQEEYQDPEIMAMNGRELYRRAKIMVSTK